MPLPSVRKSPVLGALSLLLAACSSPPGTPPDTLVVELEGPTQTINPLIAMDTNSQHINELLHASLVATSPQLVPEPYLAESFRWESDNSIFFRLKIGCTFPNGKEITARDVEKSVLAYQDEKTGSAFAKSSFERIKRVEVLDDYSFRLHTDKLTPSLVSDLEGLKIIQVEGTDLPAKPISIPGAGPYVLTDFGGGSEIRMERREQPCLPKPALPKIHVKVVRDDISRFLKLKRGELDLVLNDMNYRKVDLVLKDPTLPMRAISLDSVNWSYMGVNQNSPNLRDPRVRQALAYSFDIPALIKYKSRGMAKQSRNMLADMNYFANLGVPIYERNLEKAKQLLDEAGFSNGSNGKPPLKLTLKTSSGLISVENARVLTAQAREAGIQITHRPFDFGIFFSDVKAGNTELYTLSWTGITDPHLYHDLFHSSQIGRNNRTRYNNPLADKLIEAGDSFKDPEKRKEQYLKLQELSHTDLPMIPLWHGKHTAVFRKNVKGVALHPTGTWRVILAMSKDPFNNE